MHNKISALTLALFVTGSACALELKPRLPLNLTPDEKIRYDAHCKRREENRAFSPNKGTALATEFRRSSKLTFNYKPEEEENLTLDVSSIQTDYKTITNPVGTITGTLTSIGFFLNSATNEAHMLALLTALFYCNTYTSDEQFEQNMAETDSYYHHATNKTSFYFSKDSNGKWQLVSAADNQEIKSCLENIVNNYDLDHYIGVEDLDAINKAFTPQQG